MIAKADRQRKIAGLLQVCFERHLDCIVKLYDEITNMMLLGKNENLDQQIDVFTVLCTLNLCTLKSAFAGTQARIMGIYGFLMAAKTS